MWTAMESFSPFSQALIETGFAILLSACGAAVGWGFSRIRSRLWFVGFAIPMILLIAVPIPRLFPTVSNVFPFSLIMQGRTVYAASGVIIAMLLVTPLSRLPHRNQRVAVGVFTIFFCVYFAVLPFFMPALTIEELTNLETEIDKDGLCRQNTEYTCGPAAAVTALRSIGIKAEEGPLAIAARTSFLAGTAPDLLRTAIEKTYGVPCKIEYYQSPSDLKGKTPCIAGVDFAFLVDHYVTILEVTDSTIVVGDPLEGKERLTHPEFAKKWRKFVIVFDQTPATDGRP
jgi:hypothetical protein